MPPSRTHSGQHVYLFLSSSRFCTEARSELASSAASQRALWHVHTCGRERTWRQSRESHRVWHQCVMSLPTGSHGSAHELWITQDVGLGIRPTVAQRAPLQLVASRRGAIKAFAVELWHSCRLHRCLARVCGGRASSMAMRSAMQMRTAVQTGSFNDFETCKRHEHAFVLFVMCLENFLNIC